MAAAFDLLGIGCVAVDDCLLLDDYPPEDAKRPIVARRRSIGGTAGGALAAAACYGARCGLAGRLDRESAADTLAEFERLGVDTSLVEHQPGIEPIGSQVIVSRRTASRTVLYDLTRAAGASADWPPVEAISSAALLFIDHFGMEGMLRAAKIARSAGVPIVADFEAHDRPEFRELLGLVDHLFVSQTLASAITGLADPAAACGTLGTQGKVAVVTVGSAAAGINRQAKRSRGTSRCSPSLRSTRPAAGMPFAASTRRRSRPGCRYTNESCMPPPVPRSSPRGRLMMPTAGPRGTRSKHSLPVADASISCSPS